MANRKEIVLTGTLLMVAIIIWKWNMLTFTFWCMVSILKQHR